MTAQNLYLLQRHPHITMGRGSLRSRPVSCLFCRSRKLRCSRQFPCANCTSRGISCQGETRQRPSAVSVSSTDEIPNTSNSNNFQEDVLARLLRLENIVIGQGEQSHRSLDHTGSRPRPPKPRHRGDLTASFPEKSSMVDSDWLESQIINPGASAGLCITEYEFKVCSIKDTIAFNSTETNGSFQNKATKCVWLPLHEESKLIIDKYLDEITHLHHVIHIPSVRVLVDDLYQSLNLQNTVQLGQVSLLLAMLASTAFFWTERDMNKPVFSSVAEADAQSKIWMKIALEILEYSRLTNSESLEDIQTMIIVAFLVCNIVGITSLVRHLCATATSTAWQLSLNRIDHPNNSHSDLPRPDSVRAEMCRRVWWYLVATDWQMSQVAGLQKGTYMINPRQMATNKPGNINDEDLVDGMADISLPINQPTSASYCLQRIRLGEICREISDSIPFLEIGAGDPDYQQIKKIDKVLCEFNQALPSFFSLDHEPHQPPDTDPHKSPGIAIQRYMILSLIHTQRVRLHLPYLSQASSKPVYSYSKHACLEAARMVIRTEAQLASEKILFVLTRLKFFGVFHCVCLAIIVLLMDLCLNKSIRPEDDRERRSEIFKAFGILEEARGQSPFAEKLLGSFYLVLQRNKIPLPNVESRPATRSTNISRPSHLEPARYSTLPTEVDMESTTMEPTMPSFDEIWQTFDATVDPSALFDWDNLLSELDYPFLSI